MMEQLSSMHWDFSDALQMLDLGGGGKAYYNYDGEGKRTRKTIVRQDGTMKQRYYIGGIEIYREKDNAGQTTLERETLQLMDDKERIAMADTETTSGAAGTTLVRYQAGNHLLSACLELDDAAKLISFEEYFPFGTSSFSSADGSREIPAKRYRYTGKERDEESGLNYHGARYYAPWICRWTAADKLQKKALENRYRYVKNNPVIYNDNNGAFEEPTHGAATYYLALAAGFSVDEATQIALATAGMDHDPATEPGLDEKTKDNHFPSFAQAIKNVDAEIAKLPAPGQLKPGQKPPDLSEFGKKLHSLEDVGFVDAPGPHRRGGREPGLSESLRNAGLAIGGTGLAFAAIGALGVFLGPHMGDRIAGVVALVFGAILALIGLAAIIVSTLHVSQGIGHPIYCTERGNLSTGLVHYADEAYQDPDANRKELRKIYGKLKEGAAKLHGSQVKSDDIIAEALIGVEGGNLGVVNADSPKKIMDYLDMLSQDNYGHDAPSYAQIVRKNCQSRVTGISVGWRDVDIDITVENSGVHYKSTVIMGKCN
jgi:RHS repeat-associated protein